MVGEYPFYALCVKKKKKKKKSEGGRGEDISNEPSLGPRVNTPLLIKYGLGKTSSKSSVPVNK